MSKINTGMQLAVALAAILGGATDLPTPEMVTALAIVTLRHHHRVRAPTIYPRSRAARWRQT